MSEGECRAPGHRVAASEALSQTSLETDQWTVADTGLGMGENPRGGGQFPDSDSNKPNPTSVSGMDRFSPNQEGGEKSSSGNREEVTFATL